MIQILDDALSHLEQRVEELGADDITLQTYTNEPPFVKLQDRINVLHLRLKLIEYENNHVIKQVSNESGNILFLQTTINDLATRVKDLEKNQTHDDPPAEPISDDTPAEPPDEEPTDEPTTEPVTNLLFTYSYNGTGFQIKSNTPAYYIMVITFRTPDNAILTYVSPSNWKEINEGQHTAWHIPQSPSEDADIIIYAATDTNYQAPRYIHQANNVNMSVDFVINPIDWVLLDGYFSVFKLLKRGLYSCFMICCGNKQGYRYTFRLERVPDGWSVVGMYYRNDEGKEVSEVATFGSANSSATRPWEMWITNPKTQYEHWIRVKETATGRIIDIPMSYENAYVLGTWLIYELPN